MSRPVALACLFLAACEPVLLVADEGGGGVASGQTPVTRERDAGPNTRDPDAEAVEDTVQAGGPAPAAPDSADRATPDVALSVKAVDCGSCFDLIASGKGGAPPYQYEWEDGTRSESRRLCMGTGQRDVWVIASDSAGHRSNAHVTHLQTDAEAADCSVNTPSVKMCLENLSFEGTAGINTGQMFAAMPWTNCRDAGDTTQNTPDVANNTLDPVTGIAPAPTQGDTYLAMSNGEQVSQQLCQPLIAGSKTSLRLDAARLDIGNTAEMFLQIYGGSAAECSQRQLLWVSPALTNNWVTYCVPIHPGEFMDLITLRAETPMPDIVINYLAVDNLVAVDSCP